MPRLLARLVVLAAPTLLALPGFAATLHAQAPHITPAGDPSVNADTIYRLAADSAKYRDDPFILLLDDGVVRVEADGRITKTYRQVVQIFTAAAAAELGERTFSYEKDRQRLVVNWVRVLKPDGTVISDKPVHEQESLAPVSFSAPVYSDVMVRRLSLGGVAPGTLVDYSFTVETVKPIMPRDFLDSWSVYTGMPTRRSRLILDVPDSLSPRIAEQHLKFARKERVANGRHVYIWAARDVPKPKSEAFAPDSSLGESIVVAAPLHWSDIARWYAGLSNDRYVLTPAIDAKLTELVRGSRTLDDSLRAVHRWVAQDLRYVSLSLGIDGFRPHLPATVFANQYGDCKDKATLFIALARRMGLTAYPVLLSGGGDIDTSIHSPQQFDHMIAAVKLGDHYVYADLTSPFTPFGSLPPDEQGVHALVVHPDGTDAMVVLPEDSASANRMASTLVGKLSPSGTFDGDLTVAMTGTYQYALRGLNGSGTPPDSTARARTALTLANSVVQGATGDSLRLFDGRDLQAKPRIALHVHGGDLISAEGDQSIMTLPIRDFAIPQTVEQLESAGRRRYPIDVAAASGGAGEMALTLRIALPPGWKARLPVDVHTWSLFGRYDAVYRQQGNELTITRKLTGARGVVPASDMPVLLTWLKQIDSDNVKYLVLTHGG